MKSEALRKKVLLITDRFITALAILSAIVIVSYIVTGLTTGKQSFLGYRIMWVRTPSMEPTIMTGDFVLAKAIDAQDVEAGDIVVYRKADKIGKLTHYHIIHRIIDSTEEGNFIFKGDNNEKPDSLEVHPEQVEYKAIYVF